MNKQQVSASSPASQCCFGQRHEKQFISPNLYYLIGEGIKITYSDFGPMAFLSYHELHETLEFSKNQIRRIVVPDLGPVVSVTLSDSRENGVVHFSLLLPDIDMRNQAGASTEIHTKGIKTIRLAPGNSEIILGQNNSYTVTRLRGSAALVYY